jgi:DNA-binding transcriptional MerR regulator
MFYQLYEFSLERRKKFPHGNKNILIYSLSENKLQLAIKRLKKIDPNIKAITEVLSECPKTDKQSCTFFPGSQEDVEAMYKN